MSINDIPDLSKELYNQILNTKFDVETFENIFQRLCELLQPINTRIADLTTELDNLKDIKRQVVQYRDDTKKRIVTEVDIINQKMKRITGCDHDSYASDNDSVTSEHNTVSYLSIAKNAQNAQHIPEENIKLRTDIVRITPKTSINAVYCTSSNVLNAPIGNLLWITDKNQFALKILVGERLVVYEGNIGNIYVRGDAVSNVDLCRQSKINRPCLKGDCTFRHNPPKKGEIRNYFSASTYYPPRMDSLAKEHKGVHRIGSRENLDDDLQRIRTSESIYEYDAYVAQSFHAFLVSLVMEKGVSS